MKRAWKIAVPVMVFLFIWTGGGMSLAQTPNADQDKNAGVNREGVPKIRFRELSHDFGRALQDSKLKHTFTFQNAGQDVLIIEKIKAG